jgi:cyclopropane fatty-acyl-phospholipid synthase-like methyltransferase
MNAPTQSADFDHAYRALFTMWGDVRIPVEIAALAREGQPRSALELGCGVGRISRYLAQSGLSVTGVDFSPVAIAKARERVARDDVRPEFLTGDVTHLDSLQGPFDISVDVGCFHCLDPERQRAYVSEIGRLLRPGGTHLIWALDHAPSDLNLSPGRMSEVFLSHFVLRNSKKSRRRLVASHWYWLERSSSST